MRRGAALAAAVALAGCDATTPTLLDPATALVPGGFPADGMPDSNSVLIAGTDRVVVIDTGRHQAHRDRVMRTSEAMGRRVGAVVNTHWHLDHISGNQRVASEGGARIYAGPGLEAALRGYLRRGAQDGRHALAAGTLPPGLAADVRADLETLRRRSGLGPNVTLDQSKRMRLPGLTLELHLARGAVTAGDLWVRDPARGRIVAGDLVTLPVPFLDTACPDGWLRALDAIAAVPFTSLIPGHGGVLDRQGFATWHAAFRAFLICARGAGTPERCARRWTGAVGALPGADHPDALAMAAHYAALVRDGTLEANCIA